MDIGQLLFDKNYGFQSGLFRSEDIYLPYGQNYAVPYLITLYVENWVYAFPYMQLMPRLAYNGACTYGAMLGDYQPALAYSWFMGTMLDLDQLRVQGAYSVPICASNAFIVGDAVITLSGERLSVTLRFLPEANVELHQSLVYCITDVAQLHTAEPSRLSQQAYQPGEAIDVSGARSALLYMPLSISYDSADLNGFSYDLYGDAWLDRQIALWNENLLSAYEQPLIMPDPEPAYETGYPAAMQDEWAFETQASETEDDEDGTGLPEFQSEDMYPQELP